MIPKNVDILRADSDHPSFSLLIRQLDDELSNRYGALQRTYDEFNRISSIDTVVIAMENNSPVGCGCFKNFDEDSVEIKRMYVIPTQRGMGIARQIVCALEQWAQERGFTSAILETGDRQPEAIALYTRLGYERIPNFGSYQGMTSSVCFKKIF